MAKQGITLAPPVAKKETYADQAFHTPKAKLGGLLGKEWFLFLLFIAPNFFFLILFTYWPLFENFRLSLFTTNQFLGTSRYSGLDNYEWLLSDRTFRQVASNTAIFIIACVAGTLGIGLAIALLLNEKLKGRTAVRALVFAPYLVSGAAIGLVWEYIFNPRYGLLSEILGWLNIGSPNWLDSPSWALPAIIIVYVWKNLGFAAVVFLAGLQGIPKDLYEAAKLDGASAWWRFRSVTLPMLSPISFFLTVTAVLATFQAFDIQDIMTSGGPAFATTTLVYYVYDQAFNAQNHERAAAAAIFLFFLMLAVTLVQMLWERKQVHYGG
jgi:sn-glycerol 3-phosphate transport system permease protein